MQVTISGEKEIALALKKLEPEVLRAADRGLKAAGMNIIADAQDNLRRDNINTTGRLSQSGKVQKSQEGGYDVGFMGDKAYAAAVEYGRRAGKMPPADEMGQWAHKKLRIGDLKIARALGWAIAKSIGKHGTKPHPFFAPAVKKNEGRVLDAIRDAVLPIINRNV